MKILVVNAGSSSLKFQLFKMQDESSVCTGLIESIGEETSVIHFHFEENEHTKDLPVKDHFEAFNICFDLLFEFGIIVEIEELSAVGHRVVHGGDVFSHAREINHEVIERLKEFIPLAPLHNPANIAGILAVEQHSANIRQVAVFDTAFHHSMPEKAYRYAVKPELFFEDKIRRYGFHGSSHQYVCHKAAALLDKAPENTNIISLHLGNGASACAVQEGKSIDTSMGMTPLEGLVMGSRSGDIDAGVLSYLHEHKHYSMQEIQHLLNHESGLVGICAEHDMRVILQKAQAGNKYQLAIDLFVYRIKKYIGAYMAVLGQVDAIVFTGGIGENAPLIREMVCDGLSLFGIEIDREKNKNTKKCFAFESEGASVKLFVIATNEELEIAKQTKKVLFGE